jgi:hypothetical protein
MAYSRFSYADLYVYMDAYGSLACCGCWLGDEWYFGSTQEMVDHIAKHREAGHNMPADLEASLWADDAENFPPQCAGGHDWGEPFRPYKDDRNEFIAAITRRICRRCSWVM